MLEEALGSRSKVQILRTLLRAGDEEVTTDQIARQTDLSTGTLVPALRQLADIGVVRTRMVGRARVFRLDDAHPMADIVKTLFQAESRVIHQVAEFILEKVPTKGLRYVAWMHAPGESAERRQTVWLLVIADDPERTKEAFRAALNKRRFVHLEVLGEDQARRVFSGDEGNYRRMLEGGRVLFVDRDWLGGG